MHPTGLRSLSKNSIPTAPTNHLSDRWILNKNTQGQKGADNVDETVRVAVYSGTSDNWIQELFGSFPTNNFDGCSFLNNRVSA